MPYISFLVFVIITSFTPGPTTLWQWPMPTNMD
ncbi:hypothetical protein LSPH26S_00106 [Lysinibacillus sphaericus]